MGKIKEDKNKKELILKAAEEVFIAKCYIGAKTTEIAKLAGITHAMLHYYFRSKENLFEIVFRSKVELLANSFFSMADKDLPLIQIIKESVNQHFEFIKSNPKVIVFIITEINNNNLSSNLWNEIATPIFGKIIHILKLKLEKEICPSTIREIDPLNLIMTVLSLNIFPFLALSLLEAIKKLSKTELNTFLELRRKENIRIIELLLKP